MLAHQTYPKDAPESKALRSAFTCSGLLICLIATLVVLDVATRSDSVTLSGREAPDIKTAFMQPKPMGSIFAKAKDTRSFVIHQAMTKSSSTNHGS